METYNLLAIKCENCDFLENIKVFGSWDSDEDLNTSCVKCGDGRRVCIGLVGVYNE